MTTKDEGIAEGYLAECEDQVRTLEWQLSEATKEIERLNTGLDMVAEEREAWKATFHRAHAARGERLKACPLCVWQT